MASPDAATAIPVTGGEIFGVRIGLDPHRPGLHRVRLIDYGRPLWAIIANLQAVDGDVAQTAEDYGLPVEAVMAAKAYYEAHPQYIDAWLLINDSMFTT